MNKSLFYTHRVMVFFYGIMLVIAWAVFISLGKLQEIVFLLFITAIYGGFGFLHFKASNDVRNGLEVGKSLSQGLGCLLLLGFPIGTLIGIFILINTRKNKWQVGVDETHRPETTALNE